MTDDPNRKSMRQFQCRDYLWENFEQMSNELQCSVDYLINEAMKHYARTQGKGAQGAAVAPPAPPPGRQGGPPIPRPPMGASMAPGPMGRPGVPGPGMMPQGRPGVPGPGMMPQGQMGASMGAPMAAPMGAQGAMPGRAPTGYPRAGGIPPAGTMVYAVFEGQRYPVNKDEFYIGRSNKSCDLIVKDPNVSRQHARVVRHQGQYWMVDMGSTNGIEHNGSRVDRRPIQEGDVFRICDHEIVFTYRPG